MVIFDVTTPKPKQNKYPTFLPFHKLETSLSPPPRNLRFTPSLSSLSPKWQKLLLGKPFINYKNVMNGNSSSAQVSLENVIAVLKTSTVLHTPDPAVKTMRLVCFQKERERENNKKILVTQRKPKLKTLGD